MKKMMHLVLAGTAAFASAAVLAGGDKMKNQKGAQAAPSSQHSSASQSQGAQSPETVKKVQEALTAAGYDPGPADGKLGQKTSQALKKAQTDKSLSATGQLDSQTLTALGVSEGGSASTATGSSSSGSGASGSSPSSSSSAPSGSTSAPGSSSSSGSSDTGSGGSSSSSGASGAGASGSGASGSSGSDSKVMSPQGSEKSQ